jgi:glycerol kinase
MERDSRIPLRELRADGGAVSNSFLMQFQSNILGVPVEVPEITETTALGAAYLAGLAVGFWQSRQEIDAKWRLRRRYEPQMREAERERLYARWHEAVARAKNWARAENERS